MVMDGYYITPMVGLFLDLHAFATFGKRQHFFSNRALCRGRRGCDVLADAQPILGKSEVLIGEMRFFDVRCILL